MHAGSRKTVIYAVDTDRQFSRLKNPVAPYISVAYLNSNHSLYRSHVDFATSLATWPTLRCNLARTVFPNPPGHKRRVSNRSLYNLLTVCLFSTVEQHSCSRH
jgi:hypothetical protein